MNETIQTLAILVAALFWGGVTTLTFIVTPLRGMTPGATPEAIQAVGRHVNRYFGYVQVGLGLLLMILVIAGSGDETVIVPAVFMFLLAALKAGFIELALANLSKPTLSADELAANNTALTQLRRAGYAADLFVVVLGVALIAALVAA